MKDQESKIAQPVKKKEKLSPRGRLTGSDGSEYASLLRDMDKDGREFTLKSGKKETFAQRVIFSGDIENKTFVNPDINPRDQSKLTEESLWDILETIGDQQYFPAIGRLVDGKIEILDGSRRRAACIIKRVKFDVLVTDENISLADARALSKAIQTAKEHSIREKGFRYLAMVSTGHSQESISKIENISQASVSRAIQAASVSQGLIDLFPDLNELVYADYKYLLDITEAQSMPQTLQELETQLKSLKNEAEGEYGARLDKDAIIKLIKRHVSEKKEPKKAAPKFEPIVKFKDSKTTAKVRMDKEKRTLSYEFKRLSSETQKRIQDAITEILEAEVGKS
ncbi:ParB/RepB/Spo0J family partition protein [Photorhabdus tasmaniensis]